MRINEIVRRVRIILYRNEEHDDMPDIEGMADIDNLKADELIRSLVAPAIDKVFKIAPAWMLGAAVVEPAGEAVGTGADGGDDAQPSTAAVRWDNDADPYASVAVLDASVLRLISVKLPGWLLPVMNFTSFDDALYAQYRSEYAGIRPTRRFPAVAVGPDFAGSGLRVEAYPKMVVGSGTGTPYVKMVKKPEFDSVDDESDVSIDSRCLDSVLYMIASLWYVSTGDKERAEMMEDEAMNMVNVTNKTEQGQ